MSKVESSKDVENLTLTFTAEFAAGVERVWQVWEDPRQLERWWGPPTWPATFDRHDFEVGGESRYHMTGPDGSKAHGWWRMVAIEAPSRIEFEDGFGDKNGEPTEKIPSMTMVVTLEPGTDGTTRMTTVASFADADHLAQMEKMGMAEGVTLAMGQIDAILAG